jgi:putative hydrolase of the HAD superfamily
MSFNHLQKQCKKSYESGGFVSQSCRVFTRKVEFLKIMHHILISLNMDIHGVVFDYGNVLSTPAIGSERETLARICGLPPETLDLYYWKYRRAYDAGDFTGETYWQAVATDAKVHVSAQQISDLVYHDIRMWTGLNYTMVDWAKSLHRSRFRVGILSNIGDELAYALESEFEWVNGFDHNVWSCRVRLTKPDPQIYEIHPKHFQLPSSEILFLDDREENVAAAREVGYQVIRFTDVAQLRAELKVLGLLDGLVPLPEMAEQP